jgi:hypothetical protein
MNILEDNYNKDNDISIFSGDELVITKKINPETKEEIFIGGGYTVQSHFLKNNIPIMTSLNNLEDIIKNKDDDENNDENNDEDDNLQTAGKTRKNTYEYLAVPAGIYMINQKIPKYNISEKYRQKNSTISDDIYDKLFEYIQHDNKSKRKTRKQRSNINIKKTRKNI